MGTIPTYAPTTDSPTATGWGMWWWGSPEALGDDAPDATVPQFSGEGVTYSAAGSKYSIIILQNGQALVAGVVDELDDYQGHFGLDPKDVKQGVNAFKPISQVYDPSRADPNDASSAKVPAPFFHKAFAGVENIPDTGEIHSILLDENGNAWATGNNHEGQLCLGDDVDRMLPEKIPINGRVVDVAIGGEHTLLLLEDGSVYGCGSNEVGQIGLGLTRDTSLPTLIEDVPSVTSISAGHSHSLLMADDGPYFTGSNEYGQLCVDTDGGDILTPVALNIENKVAVSLEAIKDSSYILYEDGSVSACGRNDFGQLGDGTNLPHTMVAVNTGDHIVRLLGFGPSSQTVFFVTDEELVYGTGLNDRGQLGVGDQLNRNEPTRVKFGDLIEIDQITVSEVHSIALGTVIGTIPPTVILTPDPTYAPSTSVPDTPFPTKQTLNLYFWGAPESIGDSLDDVLIPYDYESEVVDAACGSKYTVVILQDGTALSGGYIDSMDTYRGHLGTNIDDLGQGTNTMKPIALVYDQDELAFVDAPRFVKAFTGVENSPDSGVIHTILLDALGRAWVTGSNSNGQLCLGDGIEQLTIPERIPMEGRVVDVAIGGVHTLLLDEFGNVYGCGSNADGQLGLGSLRRTSVPTLIDGFATRRRLLLGGGVTSISAGHSHSLFMTLDGPYYTGNNDFGQLCADTDGQSVFTPGSLNNLPDMEEAVRFEAIRTSSYILFSDGSVSSCGNNEFGQLGDNSNRNQILAMAKVDGVVRLMGVGPSAESVFFVTNDDLVWGTGLNDRGQLGTGNRQNVNSPSLVQFQESVMVDMVCASGDHTIALGISTGTFPPTKRPTPFPTYSISDEPTPSPREGLDLFLWGAPKTFGQDLDDYFLRPLHLENQNVVDVSAGTRYSMIVLADGTAQAGGLIDAPNDYQGHLGLGSGDIVQGVNDFRIIEQVYDPETLSFISPMFDMVFAGVENTPGSGAIHSILIDRQGRAYATGSNSMGQLCLGDFESRMTPEKIPINGRVVEAAIGAEHTLLLLDDGSVYGCGSNTLGQLGLGQTQETSLPTLIDELRGITSISAGHSHSLFMGQGNIYFTGSNEYGQLCSDTGGSNLFVPSALDVEQKVAVHLEAIKESTYILYDDGSVSACGRNNFGQLGDGSTQDLYITTVELDGRAARLVGVGPSSESVFIITDDEVVWGTGLNDKGQLGVGDTIDKSLPTRVQFGSEVSIAYISAGQDQTLAIGFKTGDTRRPTNMPTDEATPRPTNRPTASPSYNPTIDTAMPTIATPIPTPFGGELF